MHSELHTIIAHIGQGSGIAALLKGLPYYINQRNYVPLPVQGLVSHDLSEEEVLRGTFDKDKLSSLIFEVATRANDHLISANTLLEQLKHNLNSVPDAPKGGYFTSSMFLPMMSYIPTKIFLEKLESADFDIFRASCRPRTILHCPTRVGEPVRPRVCQSNTRQWLDGQTEQRSRVAGLIDKSKILSINKTTSDRLN